MKTYIGVDIGGTRIKAGLVSENGVVLKKVINPANANLGKDAVLASLVKSIKDVSSESAFGIGVGCPGPLDYRTGLLGTLANLPIGNMNLKTYLSGFFRIPIVVDNDANSCILGETIYGLKKRKGVVAGITLGTGIGGAIVIDGHIFHGRGNAGEFGHMTVMPDGEKCLCGNRGCFEEYAGNRGILRFIKGPGIESVVIKEPLDVYKLAMNKNPAALTAFQEYGRYLGIGVGNIIKAIDPDIFIIGGGISSAWNFFYPSMEDEIRKRELFRSCPVVQSKLGDESGIIGAASLITTL